MVSKGGNRVLRRRSPMRIRRRAESRVTDRASVNEQPAAFGQPKVVPAGDLHKKIMWMLAVDDRQSVGGLAGLKEFRIAAPAYGGGLQAHHRAERYGVPAEIAGEHRHEPVRREEFVEAPRTG